MDAERSFWSGRRVLVCGVTEALGAATAETLAELGAEVTGIVGSTVEAESPYIEQRIFEMVAPVRVKETNAGMIAAILAASEIECLIDTTLTQPRTTHALLSACRVGVPQAAAVIAIPDESSTITKIVTRFRHEEINPIGMVVNAEFVGDMVERILNVAELTIVRDRETLTGISDGRAMRKVA